MALAKSGFKARPFEGDSHPSELGQDFIQSFRHSFASEVLRSAEVVSAHGAAQPGPKLLALHPQGEPPSMFGGNSLLLVGRFWTVCWVQPSATQRPPQPPVGVKFHHTLQRTGLCAQGREEERQEEGTSYLFGCWEPLLVNP